MRVRSNLAASGGVLLGHSYPCDVLNVSRQSPKAAFPNLVSANMSSKVHEHNSVSRS